MAGSRRIRESAGYSIRRRLVQWLGQKSASRFQIGRYWRRVQNHVHALVFESAHAGFSGLSSHLRASDLHLPMPYTQVALHPSLTSRPEAYRSKNQSSEISQPESFALPLFHSYKSQLLEPDLAISHQGELGDCWAETSLGSDKASAFSNSGLLTSKPPIVLQG